MDDPCGNCRTTCKKCMQTQIKAEKERERHCMNRRIELLVLPCSSLLRTDQYSRSSLPFCYTDSAESTNCSAQNPPIVRTESANYPRRLPRIDVESLRGSLRKKLSFPCHVLYWHVRPLNWLKRMHRSWSKSESERGWSKSASTPL